MKGSRSRRLRTGKGDRPSRGGFGGDRASVSAAGGGELLGKVLKAAQESKHGHLRYSTQAEADAAKRELERQLRLKRLEQVRQQSRQHAAAIREDYRQRREENKRTAVLESMHEYEATKTAEVLALNQQLQNKLVEVGSAHRMAASKNIDGEKEQERLRALRSASMERRRERNRLAGEKQAGEMREARKPLEVAAHRQQVWRDEGGTERTRAREEAEKQAAVESTRRARREASALQFQQQVGQAGRVTRSGGRVAQVGPRLEDFKTSRVHAAFVLQHGSVPETRLMGVQTTGGHPAEELRRKEAAEKERQRAAQAAESRAEKRGNEAFAIERDRRQAEGLEQELKRLHNLDRLHRQGSGAAGTNLAVMRENEVRRANAGYPERRARTPEPRRVKRAKPSDGGRRQAVAEAAGAETPSMVRTEKARVDRSVWEAWPAWWPTAPPRHLRRTGVATSPAAGTGTGDAENLVRGPPSAASSASASDARRPTPRISERERLSIVEQTRRELFDAAERAQQRGHGLLPPKTTAKLDGTNVGEDPEPRTSRRVIRGVSVPVASDGRRAPTTTDVAAEIEARVFPPVPVSPPLLSQRVRPRNTERRSEAVANVRGQAGEGYGSAQGGKQLSVGSSCGAEPRAGGDGGVASRRSDLGRASPRLEGLRTEEPIPPSPQLNRGSDAGHETPAPTEAYGGEARIQTDRIGQQNTGVGPISSTPLTSTSPQPDAAGDGKTPPSAPSPTPETSREPVRSMTVSPSSVNPLLGSDLDTQSGTDQVKPGSCDAESDSHEGQPPRPCSTSPRQQSARRQDKASAPKALDSAGSDATEVVAESANGGGILTAEDVVLDSTGIEPEDEGARIVEAAGGPCGAGATSQEPLEASIPVAVDFNELAKALLAGGESTSVDRRDAAVQVTPGESSDGEGSLPRDGHLANASPDERQGANRSDGAHVVASDQATATAGSPTDSIREAVRRDREDVSTQLLEAAIRHSGGSLETSRRPVPREPAIAAASATLDRASDPNGALTSTSQSARRQDDSPSDRSLAGSFRRADRKRRLERVPPVTSSLGSSTYDPAPVDSRGDQFLEHLASGTGGSHTPSGSGTESFGHKNSPISVSGGDPGQLPVEPDLATSDTAISRPLQNLGRRRDEVSVETRQLLNMFDGALDKAKTESGFPGVTERGTAHIQGEEGMDSAVSSSTSTLPPLDAELVELLERHRYLDEEAEKLTRQDEEDVARWDLEGSSSSRMRDHTRTSFPAGLPASRDDPSSIPKSTGVREPVENPRGSSANTFRRNEDAQRHSTVTEIGSPRYSTGDQVEGIHQRKSYACPGEHLDRMPRETARATLDGVSDAMVSSAYTTTPRSVSSTATGGDIRGDLLSGSLDAVDEVNRKLTGNAGGDISSPFAEEELARALGMRDLSVQGDSGRWRSDVRGSRLVSGSWENTSQESDGKVQGSRAGVSSGRSVNMNQEVTEWARRIQASIESMNRLVDGFRSSGSGTSLHAGRATGAVSGASPSPTCGREPATRGATVPTLDGDTGIRKSSTVKAEEEPPPVGPGAESFAVAQLGFRRRLEGLLTGRSRAENDDPVQTDRETSAAHEEVSRSLRTQEIGRGSPAPNPNAEKSDIELGSRFRGQVAGSDRTVSTDALEALGERLLGGSEISWSEIPQRTRPASSATSGSLHNRGDFQDHYEHGSTSTMSVISTITSVDPAGKVSSLADDILNRSLASSDDIRSAVYEETKGEGLNTVTSPKPRRGWDGFIDNPDAGVFPRVDRGKRTAGLRGGDVSVSSVGSSSFGPDLEAEIQSLEALATSLQQRNAPRSGPELKPHPEQDQRPEDRRRTTHPDFVAGSTSVTSSPEVGKERSIPGAKETRTTAAPSPSWREQWDRSYYLGGRSPLLRDKNTWKAFPFRDTEKASSTSMEDVDARSDTKSIGTRDPPKISNLSPASTFRGVAAYTDRSEDPKRSPEPYDDFLEELRSLREAVAKLAPQPSDRPPPPPRVEIGGTPRRARLDHPSGSAIEGTVRSDEARRERDLDRIAQATPVGHAEEKTSAKHPWSSKTLKEAKSFTGESDVDEEESKGEGEASREPGVNPDRMVVGPVEQDVVQTAYRTTQSESLTDRTRPHAVDPRHGEARESSGQASPQASASDFLLSPLGAAIGGDISSLRLSSESVGRGWDFQHHSPNLDRHRAVSPTGAAGGAGNIGGQWSNRGTAASSNVGNAVPSPPAAVSSSRQAEGDEVAADQVGAPRNDDTALASETSGRIAGCDKETGEADKLGVVDQRERAEVDPVVDAVGHVMTKEETYGSRPHSPDVQVGHYADMGRESQESNMVPDPVSRDRCFSGDDQDTAIPPSSKKSTESNLEDVRAEFERSFTSEGVSLDPELLAAAVARRQAASELSPLEAPGWGSLADFIERNSTSEQSPVSRRDLRRSGGESQLKFEEGRDEKVEMTSEDDGVETTVGEVPSGDEGVLADPPEGLYSGRRGAGLRVKGFSEVRWSLPVEDEAGDDQAGEQDGSSQSKSRPHPSPLARGSVGGSSTSDSPQSHENPEEASTHEGRESGQESTRRDRRSNDADNLVGGRSRQEPLDVKDKFHSGENDEEPSVKTKRETDGGGFDKNVRGERRPGGHNISARSRSSSVSSRRARRTVRSSKLRSDDSRSLSSDDSIGGGGKLHDGERQRRRLEETQRYGEDENTDFLKDRSKPKSALTASRDRRPGGDLESDGYLETSLTGEVEAKEKLGGAAHSSTNLYNQPEGTIGDSDVAQEQSQLEESSTDLAGDEEDVDITGQLRSLLDLRERLQHLAMDTDSSGDFSRMDQEVLRSASASAAEDDEKASEKEHRRFDQTAIDESGLSVPDREREQEQESTTPTQESNKERGERRWWLEDNSESEPRRDEGTSHAPIWSQRDRALATTSPEDGLHRHDELIRGEALKLKSDESLGQDRAQEYHDSGRLQGDEAVEGLLIEDEIAASEREMEEYKGNFSESHSKSLRTPGESMADDSEARHELSKDSHASEYPPGVAGYGGSGEDDLHPNSMSDDGGLVSESKAEPKSADSSDRLQITPTKGGWLKNVDRLDAGDGGKVRTREEESGGDGDVAGQSWLMADLRDRLKHMTSDSEGSGALLQAESRSENCPSSEKERQADESRADGVDTIEEVGDATPSWSLLALRDRLQHMAQDSDTSDRLSEEIRSSDDIARRAAQGDEQAKVSEGETKSDYDDSVQSWSLLRLHDRLNRVAEDTESSFDVSQTNRSDEGHVVSAPGRDRSREERRPDATEGETERVLAQELTPRSRSNDGDGLQENDAEPEEATVNDHTRSKEGNEVQDEGRQSRSRLDFFSRTRSSAHHSVPSSLPPEDDPSPLPENLPGADGGQHSPGRRQHLYRSASDRNPLFEGTSEKKIGELVEELFPKVDDADWWLGDTHELDEDIDREAGRSGGQATEARDLATQPRSSTVTSSQGWQSREHEKAEDGLARRDSLGNIAADSRADSGTEDPLGSVQHNRSGNSTEGPSSGNRADGHSNLQPASPRPGSAEGAELAQHSSDALGRAEQIDLSGGGGSALGLACSDSCSSWMDPDGQRERGPGEEGHENAEDLGTRVEDREEHQRHSPVDPNVAAGGWAQDVVDLVATMSLEDDCSGDYSRETSVRFGRSILSDDSRLSERRTNSSDGTGSRPASQTGDDANPSPDETLTVSENRAPAQEDGSLPASALVSPPGNPLAERLEIPTEDLLQASDRSTDSQELSAVFGNRPSDGERLLPRNVAVSWNLSHAVSEHRDKAEREDVRNTAEDQHRRASTGERNQLEDARRPGELAAVFNSRASAFIERSKARETAIRQRRESRRKTHEESSVTDHPNADDIDAGAQSFAAGDDTPVGALPLTSSSNLSSGRDVERANTPGTVSVGTVGVTRPSPPTSFAEERPRRRVSTKEARERTARLYNNLPEVREAKERREKEEERVRRLVTSRNLERERSRFGRQKQWGGRGGLG